MQQCATRSSPSILLRRIFTLCTKVHGKLWKPRRHDLGQKICLFYFKSMGYVAAADIAPDQGRLRQRVGNTKKQQILLALTQSRDRAGWNCCIPRQKPVYGKSSAARIRIGYEIRSDVSRVQRG